ncbi:MAG: hypothetical protein HW402_439 [Dehalococcoidales bacterium]|nr:hypothetical protein [Dehalococcoidales bacterium]
MTNGANAWAIGRPVGLRHFTFAMAFWARNPSLAVTFNTHFLSSNHHYPLIFFNAFLHFLYSVMIDPKGVEVNYLLWLKAMGFKQ